MKALESPIRKGVVLAFCAIVLAATAASAQGVLFVANDRVGVGTNTPAAPIEAIGTSGTVGLGNAVIRLVYDNALAFQLDDTRVGGTTFWNIALDEVADEFRFNKAGAPSVRMILNGDGDMMVAGNFFAGGQQLNVPDYVFDAEYDLLPLDDLASFIDTNGHLPGVPSAEEIANTERVNMTDLQMRLLEKVEELTLYTLQQQEVINSLQARLQTLER